MSSIRTRSSAPLCLKAGFRHALKSGMILLSQPTFEEIDEVLAREKFDDYLTPEERAAFIEALVERSRFANPTEEVQACRDPDDDKFLELAMSENAECIVNADQGLNHRIGPEPLLRAIRFSKGPIRSALRACRR